MANDHFLELPKAFWGLKIAQLVLSVVVLGLTAYAVSLVAFDGHILALFTSLFSIIILVYYFVAFHAAPKLYSWVALLVLEVLAVIFWLSSWAVLAALYSYLLDEANAALNDYCYYYYCYTKRSLDTRDIPGATDTYNGVLISALTFSVINFILFAVTLGFIAMAGHRHRKAGGPMGYASGGVLPYSQNEVKTEPTTASAYSHAGAPVQQSAPTQTQYTAPMQTQTQTQAQGPISPVPSSTPAQSQTYPAPAQEVPGSHTYQ